MESDELVDVRTAAALVGRNAETVRRWIWSGRLPSRRAGNRLLVARADLLARADPPSAPPPPPGLSLARWARLAAEHRRGGEPVPGGGGAADLVLQARRRPPDGGVAGARR